MKHISISPSASSFYHNEEAAPVGEALTAVNLRQRCQCVEVVGTPEKVGEVPAGHRIICIYDGEYVTTLAGDLYLGGTVFHHTDAEVLEAHSIKQFLVVNTTDGALYFTSHDDGKLSLLDFSEAIPELHLSAISAGSVSESLPPFSFSSPLTYWRTPLASADISSLAATLRSAYQRLHSKAKGSDAYTRPILARYAVRTFTDQYLWISAPVMIGYDCVKSNYRTQAEAVSGESQYTGIGSASVELPTYKLGVSVVNAPAAAWRRLIKSVDIFVTDEADTADTSLLDYRLATTTVGTKKYIAEFGPAPRDKSTIVDELMAYRWRMVASCVSIDALADHEFRAWGVSKSTTSALPDIPAFTVRRSAAFAHTLTPDDCATIVRRCSTEHLPTCTMVNGGRLYMGGGGERLKAAWKPSALFAGTYTAQPCTVWLTERLSTECGVATIVSAHSYPFTPSAINPLICAPRSTATAFSIEVSTEQGTTAMESDITPVDDCAFAAAYSPDLQPVALAATTPLHGAEQTAVVSAHGRLTVSHIGQPLVQEFCHTVTGAEILALAATERPIYSGGFGRHPLYVFSSQGIYVVPQSSSGAFGEAKLMSRKVIDAHTWPVSGGGKVWFVGAHSQLCAIEGSKVEVVIPQWHSATLAWNDAEHELWSLQPGGTLHIADADGFFSQLTLALHSLYFSGEAALAVTPDGGVLNICSSVPAEQQVKYVSHPVGLSPDMRQQVEKIIWKVFGADQHLRLSLLGGRGESLNSFNICSVNVDGNICAPIVLPVISPPARTVRLKVEGTSSSGTIILGADLYFNANRHL